MNSKIEEALSEYDNRNFENALTILDGVDASDDELKFVSVIRYDCLMKLMCYDESLKIINSLIEKDPYDVVFWISKMKCHYFSQDKKAAKKAMFEVERLSDKGNINDLLCLAENFHLIRDNENALKYCDMALEIDGNSLEAISQKSLIASSLEDNEMMNECADKLVELYGDDALILILPLMLRMFSGNYKGCFELINNNDCLDDEHVEMVMIGLYNRMCEELNVKICLSSPSDMGIEEALELLLKYHYDGVGRGKFKDVEYCVMKGI